MKAIRNLVVALVIGLFSFVSTVGVFAAQETPPPSAKETVTPEAGEGTRVDPIVRGQSTRVGDYEVEVVGVKFNATDQVLAENMFNELPEEGRQFTLVTFRIKYLGDETGEPWIDLDFSAVGKSNVAYGSFDDYCGVIPNSINDVQEIFPDGEVKANVCWSIKKTDAKTLLVYVEPLFSFDDDERVFFALRKDEKS